MIRRQTQLSEVRSSGRFSTLISGEQRYSQRNLNEAEKYFRTALKLGLSMDHDVAMTKLSLAGIAMQKRRKIEAQTLLTEAKKLDKGNLLLDQIKFMQQQLKKI